MSDKIDNDIIKKIQGNFNYIEENLHQLTARMYALEKAIIVISKELRIDPTVKKNIEIEFLDMLEQFKRLREK